MKLSPEQINQLVETIEMAEPTGLQLDNFIVSRDLIKYMLQSPNLSIVDRDVFIALLNPKLPDKFDTVNANWGRCMD